MSAGSPNITGQKVNGLSQCQRCGRAPLLRPDVVSFRLNTGGGLRRPPQSNNSGLPRGKLMLDITRRKFIILGGAGAVWPLVAPAQQSSTRMKRVAWLRPSADDDFIMETVYAAFPNELQKLGWNAGHTIQIDVRSSAPDERGMRGAAEEILATAPDVLVTNGTPLTAISQQRTRTIPIVFANVADPIASGFVASFARPGGNLTGFTSVEYSLAGKWLSVLKDIAPTIARVMVLFNPVNSNWTGYLPVIEAGAPSLRLSVTPARVSNVDDIARAIGTFGREQGGGMIVLPSALGAHHAAITALAAQHRLPAIYAYDYYVERGGLVSYGSDTRDVYRRAAGYVDRILKGEKPGDLPVQAPVKFELVINLKTAKALGLEIPYNLLVLADRVID
jgi:ABC-type uncharacterized transport system substrate-binding protein